MQSTTIQSQIDRLVQVMFNHGQSCGDISAIFLCAEMIETMTEYIGQTRPVPADRSKRRQADEVVRIIHNASVMVPELLLPGLPRAVLSQQQYDRPYTKQASDYLRTLASNRRAIPEELIDLVGATYEVLHTARSLRFTSDASLDDAKPASDCCILTAYAVVHTIHWCWGIKAGGVVEDMIYYVTDQGCVDVPRTNPDPATVNAIRDKDLRILARTAVAQGFELKQTKSNHFILYHPDLPGQVTFHSSGDHRAYKNTKAALKRLGVEFG